MRRPLAIGPQDSRPERQLSSTALLEHDPEKWKPVFRKDHAPLRISAYGATPRLHSHEAAAEAVTLGGDPVEDGSVHVIETVGKTLRRSFNNDLRMRNRCEQHLESDTVLIDRAASSGPPACILNSRGRRAVPLSSGPAVLGLTLGRKFGR